MRKVVRCEAYYHTGMSSTRTGTGTGVPVGYR